ncbi:MAG TPA: glycosyltransferase family 4 protein [Longimicrobiaceae bacterium]|nr:glycosyltransferase family 4 protein [Longimicrobiaceae bacterium]
MLFVGAFPPEGKRIHGGMVSSCAALLASSFPDEVDLLLVDSTQQEVPPPPVLRRALHAARRVARVVWLVERRRPDVVLLFAALGLSLLEKGLCAAYARLRGVPSLLSLRGGAFMDSSRRSPWQRRLFRPVLANASYLVCQGDTWRSFFGEVYGIPAERCPVVQNWTASPELLRIGAAREYGARARVRLLFVGWLDDTKGVFELLEALARLAATPGLPQVQLAVAGEGNASEAARAWVRARELADRVTFLGWIDGEEKLRAFAGADLFVLPSHGEGLPNAMVEAMATGLPVVVTPVGSVPDVVESGRQGVLVPVGDADALARALEPLVADPAARERLGREGHRTARERFGVEEAVARLTRIIHRAREEASGGRAPVAGIRTEQEHP